MNKNDPRVTKTLKLIDRALLDNLKQKPFPKITVDMICESAMINRSTFYKHYQDKYDLLDDYLKRVMDEFVLNVNVDFIDSSVGNIDDQAYIDSFSHLLAYINDHKEEYQTIWRADIARNIYEEMTAIVQRQIFASMTKRMPKDRKKLTYFDFYSYLFASNMMALVHWLFMNSTTITQEDARQIMENNMKEGMFAAFKKLT